MNCVEFHKFYSLLFAVNECSSDFNLKSQLDAVSLRSSDPAYLPRKFFGVQHVSIGIIEQVDQNILLAHAHSYLLLSLVLQL